jgi:hypothetical protein
MGNAYVANVNDLDSLFYNPAGLAKVHGIQLDMLTASAAGKNLDDYKTLKSLADSSTDLSTALPPLYGKDYFYSANARSGIALPMFGAAVYNATSAQAQVHNPPFPEIDVKATNDYTYALGFGVPLGPFVQVGAEGRYIKRTGVSKTYTGADFANLSNNQIASDITAWGRGYELDLGANFLIPVPLATFDFSVVWQNVGNTTFIQDSTNSIPSEPNNLVAGVGADIRLLLVTIRPEFDIRHITDADIQLFRKFNFGVEVSLPLIDIRGGFSEGYYTYGAGMSFGPIRVDAASYAAELGDYPGQIEDRRYMATVSIELDLGNFGVDDSRIDPKSKGSGSGSSGASGSGSQSIWGGSTRLKERR